MRSPGLLILHKKSHHRRKNIFSLFLHHPNVLAHHNGGESVAYCSVKVTAVSVSGECLPWPRVRHAETRGDMQRVEWAGDWRHAERSRGACRVITGGPARHPALQIWPWHWPWGDMWWWWHVTCGLESVICPQHPASHYPCPVRWEERPGYYGGCWWYQAWSVAASVANPISAGGKSQAQAARALLSGEIMGLAKIRSGVTQEEKRN